MTDRAAGSNRALVEIIRQEIGGGAIAFARLMELALYHPVHGYYLSEERRPGRGGDFLTAPEATPYFGITLARQIAECWERLGKPDRFEVREYGSGIGGLAYDIIAGISTEAPNLAERLTYRLAEINPHRQEQALRSFAEVGLGRFIVPENPSDPLPPIAGVILANEVADALPVNRLVFRKGSFKERLVVWRDDWFAEEELEPTEAALDAGDAILAEGIPLSDGDQVDVSPAASAWFQEVAGGLERGYAIVIDYGYEAKKLYAEHRLSGTVRGYHAHTVTDDPFTRVGEQDLTAHVDFTALQRAGETAGMVNAGFTIQGAFLAGLGLGDFLLELQKDPATSVPEYLAAQSAVMRIIEPGGLGRFGVLIMAKDAPVDPPLRGFSVAPPSF